jgi:tRNA pseudouridine55 synthase
MNGILIIDKPAGITSHDVVARVRRILRTKRVGHTGTLDPFATGVMVILVGKATRLAQFLDKDRKEYVAAVRFGFETETGDLTGAPKETQITNYELRIADVEAALTDFRGEIMQTPPMYSAKKIEGKKLYELARKGIEIERQPVSVNIYELELVDTPEREGSGDGGVPGPNYQPANASGGESAAAAAAENKAQSSKIEDQITIRVACSAGTYIRTLAEDIGRRIGTGAHLAALRRTGAGRFDLSQAVTLEKLEATLAENKLDEIFVSMNEAVSHLPAIELSADEVLKVQNGMPLKCETESFAENQAVRLTDGDENLLAIGFYKSEQKMIQPRTVLL